MIKKFRNLSFCFTFLILFGLGCALVPITVRRQLSLVSQEDLVAFSETSYREVITQSTLSKNTQSLKFVTDVGTKIAQSAEAFLRDSGREDEIQYYDWEFNVIQEDKVKNAFCMPGGKIVVYSGILPTTKNANGLAVVLGHEVAHAIANHGGERLSQQLLIQLGGQKLAGVLKEKPEKTRQVWTRIYGVGTSLGVLLPYSRLHEKEADRIGLILMARAGFDPREAASFWQRMNQAGGERPPEFLSSHPAPTKRIEALKEVLPEALEYYS